MRDIGRLLDVVDPAAHSDGGSRLPWSVLVDLAALIGCDEVSFQVMDDRRRYADQQIVADGCPVESGPEESDELFWQGFQDCLACSYPQRTGDHRTVTRLSDFYSRRDFARTTMAAYLVGAGVRHEMLVPLPPDGALDRRILFFRSSGSDFTDRDVAVLTLLRPHLLALHQRQRRRETAPVLTSRQHQILTLVATGRTNGQVARALSLSEATVGKHLENIYARLEVTNRTAAVAAVMTAG